MAKYQRHYRTWALVTGSSAGIGFACAMELASRTFNIILLSHREQELAEACVQIKSANPSAQVETVVLDCTSATAEEVEKAVEKVSHLDITVLVNNVGGMVPAPPLGINSLRNHAADDIEATINLNLRFMTHMTRLMLPVLIRNGPALIISMSSQARFGCPFTAVYSGSKAFVAALSNAVNRECKVAGLGVSAVAVIAGEVQSQANSRPAPGMIKADVFARKLFNSAPHAASKGIMEVTPDWKHRISGVLLNILPERLRVKLVVANLHRSCSG